MPTRHLTPAGRKRRDGRKTDNLQEFDTGYPKQQGFFLFSIRKENLAGKKIKSYVLNLIYTGYAGIFEKGVTIVKILGSFP